MREDDTQHAQPTSEFYRRRKQPGSPSLSCMRQRTMQQECLMPNSQTLSQNSRISGIEEWHRSTRK